MPHKLKEIACGEIKKSVLLLQLTDAMPFNRQFKTLNTKKRGKWRQRH